MSAPVLVAVGCTLVDVDVADGVNDEDTDVIGFLRKPTFEFVGSAFWLLLLLLPANVEADAVTSTVVVVITVVVVAEKESEVLLAMMLRAGSVEVGEGLGDRLPAPFEVEEDGAALTRAMAVASTVR